MMLVASLATGARADAVYDRLTNLNERVNAARKLLVNQVGTDLAA